MKRVTTNALLWVLFGISAAITLLLLILLTAIYAAKYGFLYVPFASWFVLTLTVLTIVIDGFICYCFWRRWRRTVRELVDLKSQPLDEEIPAVHGHKQLDRAEFLTLIQILFRRPADAKHIHVSPLPGGHGGGTTVLVKLHRQRETLIPKAYVVKLGDRREMADEHDKFHKYVEDYLPRAARFFRYAEWQDLAGIAYEFVGLEPDHEIQSLYQFYQGHASVEVSELIGEAYDQLGRAWHRNGQKETVDLCSEYHLLQKKHETIIGHVGEVVDEGDPYRANFTAIEERLRPNLKPGFYPPANVSWHDPVVFLRTWPKPNLSIPVHRSIIHGDLHTQNVLVEIGRDGHKYLWFIDFSHTGNGLSGDRTREMIQEGISIERDRGHTLRDFARLEADVKHILTTLENEDDLRQAMAFEKELVTCGVSPYDLQAGPPPIDALLEERFQKAWLVIREIRRRAAEYLVNPDDIRPYYLSLLHATLPIVYYRRDQFENEACECQQKRYALLSAGLLCGQL
jgi:hypothetical protein